MYFNELDKEGKIEYQEVNESTYQENSWIKEYYNKSY